MYTISFIYRNRVMIFPVNSFLILCYVVSSLYCFLYYYQFNIIVISYFLSSITGILAFPWWYPRSSSRPRAYGDSYNPRDTDEFKSDNWRAVGFTMCRARQTDTFSKVTFHCLNISWSARNLLCVAITDGTVSLFVWHVVLTLC